MCNRGDLPGDEIITNKKVDTIIRLDENGNEVEKTYYVKKRVSSKEFEKYYEPLMKHIGAYRVLKEDKNYVWITFKVAKEIPIGCTELNETEKNFWIEVEMEKNIM